MNKYFVGYVTLPTISSVTDTQARKLTHLNLAFAPMKDGETAMTLDDRQLLELARLRRANPNLAILVSTGGGGDRGHGEATSTPEGLDKLTDSTVRLVERYNLDGIDCDWEFPGDTGIMEEKYQHTALFADYRKKLDALGERTGKKYWLTTAAGAGEWYLNRTEIEKSQVYLDFINLMTYDSNTDSTIAGHHTHLYESKAPGCPRIQSADHNVRIMVEAGVPVEKILIGVAFFSHRWDQVPDVNHGLYQQTPFKNMFGPSYTEISMKFENKMDYIKYWDGDACAPFLYNGTTFISYDDPRSVQLKCQYALDNNMGGAFYWVHHADIGSILFDTIYDCLNLYYKVEHMIQKIKEFIKKETVLCIAALCATITMFLVTPDKEYLHYIDFRVLCLLLCLMAVVAGFKSVGAFQWLTCQLLSKIKNGRLLSLTLVLLPFFCSMLVTNDVALLVFVPFTLGLLIQLGCDYAIIPILVLQTIAANLGSMATPVGNPQNLFLYAAFELGIGEFFGVVLPLTVLSLVALSAASIPVLPKTLPHQELEQTEISSLKQLILYGLLFVLCLLTVFRVVHYLITTAILVVVLLLVNRKLLKEIDYMLLLTFVCFFVVSENLGRMDTVRHFLQSLLGKNTLLTAVGASQVISNVPAAVLLSGFTESWQDLLAGVNIGGLGTPIASLASLITLKLYIPSPGAKVGRFLGVFTLANLLGLVFLLTFYWIY